MKKTIEERRSGKDRRKSARHYFTIYRGERRIANSDNIEMNRKKDHA